jgi:predicted DNA-binding antitoxin AbrB/MazE fold protein
MEKTVEAVYENGVLRPLETLPISDRQHVLVTISDVPVTASDVGGTIELSAEIPPANDPLPPIRNGSLLIRLTRPVR